MKQLLLVTTFAFLCLVGTSQQRYLDEIFSEVEVTENIHYGSNISILTGMPALDTLLLDFYEPMGDTVSQRPLIVYIHTGSFLPPIINQQATGDKQDSTTVEMCTQFAKRGFAVAAINYRLGWLPTSTDQNVRTGTLIQAAYRGFQDAKNAVRFFKSHALDSGNTFAIDTSKIVVGGNGTGGYITSSYMSMDRFAELTLTKFINLDSMPPEPYIDTALLGNIDGTNNRPLCVANYPGISSAVQMTFNMGGAIPDSSWVEAGEVPMVGFHTTEDPLAPYMTGAVIVPTTGEFVIEASGTYDFIRRANQTGNNAVFDLAVFDDVYTQRADMINDGWEGLFPLITPDPGADLACGPQVEQSSPWEWWDENAYAATVDAYISGGLLPPDNPDGATSNCLNKRGNPDMSAEKARAYIDTIQGYLAPRIVCALGLAGCVLDAIPEYNRVIDLDLYPNPARTEVQISHDEFAIRQVRLFNAVGQLVMAEGNINSQRFTMEPFGLEPGLYFVEVLFDEGSTTKKLILE